MSRVSGFSQVALLICAVSAAVVLAQGQQGTVQETRGEVSRGGTSDPNVKSARPVNPKAGSNRQAPPNKGGEKSRQISLCDIHVDNRTNLYIDVWVNGSAEGLIGPYADLSTWALIMPMTLYARADFDDGSRVTWGPTRVQCPTGSFTWRLLR